MARASHEKVNSKALAIGRGPSPTFVKYFE